ncbi:zonadhesin-like [Cydia amplana]|uniref:zonadhesin-like n=1 Tax=Cydia amplana TaxID=1869771 RepID=UPI002FE556B4
MMAVFIILLVVGVGVSATTPKKPKERPPIDPIVPIECGPNSHFERCSKICPPQDCSALIDPHWLCENSGYKSECRCNDGFYRQNGICISRDECIAQCGPLERYVSDSAECQRTCANYKVTAPRSLCKPFSGCVCEEGRVRLNDNATGPCVLPKDCPPRPCPLHEHWQDCPGVCANETCISKSPTYKCLLPAIPLPCKGRCMCDKGYLRNHLGDCVLENHCPIKECPKNEVWRCASMCPRDSCKRLEAGFQCPPGIVSVCIPACACKDGYLRNDKGICIPRELCPASLRCGINEVAVECQAYPPQTCESVYTLYKLIDNPPCNPGCDCRPGYLRNKRNICVPSDFCPTVPYCKCGPNQEYKECGSICEPSCSDLDNPSQVCPAVCVKGCFCKEGFVKDEHGNCVYPSQCPLPICNKPNEVAKDCGSYCEMRTCEDYNRTDIACPAVCVRGCFCREGYVRNAYGVCIHPKKCPSKPVCLQEHEEYQSCGSSCPDNCANYKNPDRICTMQCVAGCNCKKGYVRNLKNGTCIKPEQCPIKECTGENEELHYCASYCPVTCANRYTQGDWVCITLCRVACDCIPGTLRNDTGSCVPVDQCTPPICRENEKYMQCGTACPITCDNYKNPPKVCTDQCIEDCFCKEGYVRNRFGRCVKPEDCEPTCPAGEKWNECSAHCQDTCENYNSSNRLCTYQCQSGCVCETGTVRRKDGKCVQPTECTEKIICPIDEVYDPCSAHCEPTCENHGPDRACTAICKPGCKCREGLVRRKDGKCVKLKECPEKIICPIDEVYDPCSAHCEPTCENHGPDRACTAICKPGCKCREGLVRRKDGKCVKLKECRKYYYRGLLSVFFKLHLTLQEKIICPIDEVYDPCSAHCEPTCENHGPDRACTAICKPGCKCREGLVRRKDGKCVKLKECQPTCPSSEHYDECNAHCEETCELHGSHITCLPYCNAGCMCNKGLVRRKDGQCVNLEDCYDLCPVNEVYDPCITPKCPPGKSCIQVCRPGCRCKNGLVRDKKGKCVIPKCPVNEQWVTCVMSLCIALRCDQLGFPIACPDIIGPCDDGGCVCAKNYVRDSNNVCIPKKNCPSCNNDFNATSGCGNHCGRQCTDYKNPPKCNLPVPCEYNGCDCKKGFVWDIVTGRCLDPVDCPVPCKGDLYAEKVKCPNPCPPTCARPTTAICPRACLKEGCQCRSGFVLNPDGKCVRPENCPDKLGCNGDPNAQISSCVSLCEPTCGENPIFCPALCRLGCKCKSGFILSKPGGICIKPEKCVNATTTTTEAPCKTSSTRSKRDTGTTTKHAHATRSTGGQQNTNSSSNPLILCPNDEIWIDCKSGYCKPQYCRDIGRLITCPQVADPCPGGCICRKGLLRRDGDGVCIPENECPINKPCSDPNAIRKKCASHESCRATCSVPNSKICPKICIINGCECKKEYVLSGPKGKCIKIQDCPKGNVSCNGDPNAEIMAFPPPCPSTCKMPNGIPGCLMLGQDVGCVCKPGYIKDDNDKCILPDNCKGKMIKKVFTFSLTSLNFLTFHMLCPVSDRSCGNPCGENATFAWCKVNCPNNYCPVDDRRVIIACDPPYPCPSGCVCKLNHRRKSQKDDRCILSSDCPPVNCTRPNEKWSKCPSACLSENCEDVNNQPTTCNTLVLNCDPRCICKKGCFRNASDICVPAKDCPNNQPCDDPNAERLKCAPAPVCRSTCARPNVSPCILSCAVNECVCKKGFVLSKKGGTCIPVDQCPKDVPCNGDSNAVIIANPPPCPSTCDSPNASYLCRRAAPPFACQCKDGLIKATYDGKCIKPEECPGGNPCGPNATFVPCNVRCSNGYCPVDDKPVITPCKQPYPCPSGCACKINYKRKSINDDRCILASTCPRVNCTRPNELWNPCPQCLAESCADVNNQPTTCNTLILNCQPQCVCKKGYFRNSTISIGFTKDTCIPAKDCPQNKPCEDPNAERVQCAPDPSCRSTCATPNPSPCREICAINQCVCKKGYVLSKKGGKCIPVDKCPKDVPCNGDCNAVIKANPIPCPSTCSAPNASPWCKRYAPPVGCECKPGYLLNDKDKCITPDQCPGGNPCGKNASFVPCSFDCPSNTCPVGDSKGVVACSPPHPCASGCSCKKGYKRKSSSDYTCILASDCQLIFYNYALFSAQNLVCPPNEVVSECYNSCLMTCKTRLRSDGRVCHTACIETGCVCKEGYLRHDNGTCVPISQCSPPRCNDNETYSKCGTACPPTCQNRGDNCTVCTKQCVEDCFCNKGLVRSDDGCCIKPKHCPQNKPCEDPNAERVQCAPDPSCRSTCATPNPSPCIEICAINQCVCKKGYVLSKKGGKCIPVNQCPKDVPCNGDCNAVIKANPIPCPSTCSAPNASPWCKRYAPPVGCECKPGYLLNDKDKCITPDQCPGGNPCGKNASFVPCSVNCPSNICPVGDNKGIIACSPPHPCSSGCSCKKGYKRKSSSDYTCILASDCLPPIKCKKNEVYNPCSIICPPQTCDSIRSSYNCEGAPKCKPGCDCISEYLRNGTSNDPCIPSDLCPTPQPVCGINEHYETNRIKCELTCKNYHLEPIMGPCQPTSACFCDDGYVRNSNGLCILKKKCPQNLVCPPNEVVSECYNSCLMTCKTRLRSDGRMCHLACIETGCVCKEGYLRHDNGTCVPISQCSPPRCNDNETYSKCGTACPPTCQNRGDNCTVCTKQCVEDCFCNKGLVRSDDGGCIKPKHCPPRICSGLNEALDPCPPTCPPTDGCENMWSKFNCTNAIKCCKPQCRCKSGYLRKNKVCVPTEQCLN